MNSKKLFKQIIFNKILPLFVVELQIQYLYFIEYYPVEFNTSPDGTIDLDNPVFDI